jgi:protein-tyrosine phosphatase
VYGLVPPHLRDALVRSGCTLVVSLLSREESQASEGEGRLRVPLQGARPPSADRDEEIRAAFARMDTELGNGGRLYVHCSAGLHRTGMFAFAYLRHRGLATAEAVTLIRELRPLTADELTEDRLAWGQKFAR